MKLSAAHDSSGSEHPDVRGQIDEEEGQNAILNAAAPVKKAKVSATNYKQCLALQVPGFVAFYRSRADFVGVDVLTLEVRSPDGTTQVQRISVTVGTGSPGRRI
jgi:hypothetical protein